MALIRRTSLARRRVNMTSPFSRGWMATEYSRPERASLPIPALPRSASRMTANALDATSPSGAR